MTFYEALVIAMNKKSMRPSDICAKTGLNDAYSPRLHHSLTELLQVIGDILENES